MSPPTLPPGYTLHEGYPAVPTYIHLRAAAGLSPHSAVQAEAAMRGSWYGCYIAYHRHNSTGNNEDTDASEEVVAMGRIIGDGGWYFHIADMAVLPDHQRKGLGDAILKDLLARIRLLAPPPEPGVDGGKTQVTYVNLLADGPGRRLYARNGFVDSMPHSMGMVMTFDEPYSPVTRE
ncbi:hypothetical protein BDV25DRAFT_147959 [Aspergillus avenaceus]|uniref:N-acetyltransferase domain-containing protein n=1 Tax=Aspergillus avenaceus TaxID=36643 RepID=A0A5N6U7E5_ASPAV|nr:hypothetical protein BDV25DRAFT_147959 [Aspergillus avenaceus]